MSEHFSYDRHVDGDTKFSRGRWELKAGVKILWATDNVKTVFTPKELYSVHSTRPVHHRGDTLNNGIITTRITSPHDDILKLETYHHKSAYVNSREPRFEVTESRDNNVVVDQTSITAHNLSAKIDSNGFGITFSGKDGLLTKLGVKSIGYVEDSRYEKPGLQGHKATDYTTCQFHLSVGETVYGLGERYGAFVKNGQHVEMWNEDGGTSTDVTYKNIPFYLTNRGYGIFVDSTLNVNFEVQSERNARVNITALGQGMRIYVIYGSSLKQVISNYAKLTGFPALPPAWSFGLWLTTSFLTDYDQKTVTGFLQGMKDRDIPLTTFHFDCFWMKGFQWCDFKFDPHYFPDAKLMLAELKKSFGIKICVWINPYISQESDLFDECDRHGYFIKTISGASYQTDLWQGGMGIVDFLNPEAYQWYQSKLLTLLQLGVDSFKTDFGERIPSRDVVYWCGHNSIGMHNYYTYLYNKCVFEVLENNDSSQACLFARSATAGSQKFPVHWGGDCESTFEAMAETLRGGLSLSLCGFGFWSHDIGGFEGNPDPAVYKRWCAFGLLSSHSRLHGSHSYRVPWNFDEEASVVLRKFVKLKLWLMPYIFSKAVEAHVLAVPVMRPMVLEFPQDRVAQTCDRQFMLGECILVAPVFNAQGNVSYYLPGGKWYGLLDGKVRHALGTGDWFDEIHDFTSLPLCIRENSVFLSGDLKINYQHPEYDYDSGFLVNIYDVVGTKTVDVVNVGGKTVNVITVEATKTGYIVSAECPVAFSVRIFGKQVREADIMVDEFGNSIVYGKDKVVIDFE